MRKKRNLLTAYLVAVSFISSAQCLTAPAFPTCTGTEPLVVANDNIGVSQTKYFYGTAASLANVKLSGGTLVVCGDLTLTEMVFDSGTIFIQPAATLIVSNGAGIVVKGNTAIYNAGIFQCLGNYVMDGTYATPSKPNIFVNTSTTSWFKMPNQYFVINNSNSKLVNNGLAEFWGLITDPQAAAGSVCLGNQSQIKMTVLYNRAKNPYVSPAGPSCVAVSQYSQFYDTLTTSPNINFCLSSLHTSDASCIPWGCKPNAWGAGQIINNCNTCATLFSVLSISLKIEAIALVDFNQINWQTAAQGRMNFYILRSTDGNNFITIDSVQGNNQTNYSFKDYSFSGEAYYKVLLINGNQKLTSNIVSLKRPTAKTIFPNPFTTCLTVPIGSEKIESSSVKVTDILGRKINPEKIVLEKGKATLYLKNVSNGVYLVIVNNGTKTNIYKALKEN